MPIPPAVEHLVRTTDHFRHTLERYAAGGD
jgi:hypothetical protein